MKSQRLTKGKQNNRLMTVLDPRLPRTVEKGELYESQKPGQISGTEERGKRQHGIEANMGYIN